MTQNSTDLSAYRPNNIRVLARKFAKVYKNLDEEHVYWIARELNIYPDGKPLKRTNRVPMMSTGKINRDNVEFVTKGRLNDKGISAIEEWIKKEGYEISNEKVEEMEENKMAVTNIWEQVDLIALMKKDFDKAVADRDSAKAEADHYCQLADRYEKEIDELKDKLLIAEKENNALISEKRELGQMQLKTVNFNEEIESLQKRVAQYNAEINAVSAEVNEFRKDVSVLLTGVTQLQEKKKKLEGVMSDLVGCSKRLMNMK